jgi:hypothetical protein
MYLSSLSSKLSENYCNMPCSGDAGSICGGRLTLTLYNLNNTVGKKGAADTIRPFAGGMFGTMLSAVVVGAALLVW